MFVNKEDESSKSSCESFDTKFYLRAEKVRGTGDKLVFVIFLTGL